MFSQSVICRVILFAVMFSAHVRAWAQEHVYVNTDNLIMRDRPEKTYKVLAILHAPCKLEIEPMNEGYVTDKAVVAKYQQVSIRYKDTRNIAHYIRGYVMKKYVINALPLITVKGADTTNELVFDEIPKEENEDPEEFNCALYTYPTYKGGELQFEESLTNPKIYVLGPRGGCFYFTKNGNRIYVDKKFCEGQKGPKKR